MSTDPGSCTNWEVRWYYNYTMQRCDRFWYGGCNEGNGNNFKDEKDCIAACGPHTGMCLSCYIFILVPVSQFILPPRGQANHGQPATRGVGGQHFPGYHAPPTLVIFTPWWQNIPAGLRYLPGVKISQTGNLAPHLAASWIS